MEINEIISWTWFIQLVIGTIITSFVVAILHTRSGRERIVENATSADVFNEHVITGCSSHINNRLIITVEKKDDFGDIKIVFLPRPVIGFLFGGYLSEDTITAINRRIYIIPTNIDKYIIKIKSGKSPAIYSIEYEWEGTDLTKYLLSKLKNILSY
jgi:hypothetical protein